jgi:hypothetical protein
MKARTDKLIGTIVVASEVCFTTTSQLYFANRSDLQMVVIPVG